MQHALSRRVGTSTLLVGSLAMVAPMLAGPPATGAVAVPDGASTLATASDYSIESSASYSMAAVTGASRNSDGSVTPEVREFDVPEADGSGGADLAAQSDPLPVAGFGVVGATWTGTPPEDLKVAVRTQSGGTWSKWGEVHGGSCAGASCSGPETVNRTEYEDHGPNAGSLEADRSRSGTSPLAIGEVDEVQVRATSATGRSPRDLQLSVVDPGRSVADGGTAATISDSRTSETSGHAGSAPVQQAAYSTSTSTSSGRSTSTGRTGDKRPGVRAPRPYIRGRGEWGADRRMRSGSPRYGRVKAGFVHHTVNANRYSRADVPAIIRGIYAYHTQSLGWSDIGYNFLVDKFGRKWVGRAGGTRRAVTGAHAYGYNHVAIGIAAIGNFEIRRPPDRMVRAFGRMLGWKLGLHGVRVGGDAPWLEGSRFRAVSGHRDAGQTACPGFHLYRRLADIREGAIRWQRR